jgi:hypothetical protein
MAPRFSMSRVIISAAIALAIIVWVYFGGLLR